MSCWTTCLTPVEHSARWEKEEEEEEEEGGGGDERKEEEGEGRRGRWTREKK